MIIIETNYGLRESIYMLIIVIFYENKNLVLEKSKTLETN